MLTCYEATPSSEFVCSRQGFQEIARPEESVCPDRRDALIECAYPEVKTCLNLCRAFDASYGADAAGGEIDAGDGRVCPSYDIPCDSICWLVPGLSSTGVEPDDDMDGGMIRDAAVDVESVGEQLFICAIERADACRNPPAGEPAMSANWASVLFDCFEELEI